MEQENTQIAQPVLAAPLQQISQDRINQIRIPQSPSVPNYLSDNLENQSRCGSDIEVATDVRSKIAFLNSIANSQSSGNTVTNSFAITASPTRSPTKLAFNSPTKSHSRANSTVSIPANQFDATVIIQALQSQLEQSRNRERLVAERVESLIDQLTNSHSRNKHEKQAYEKEIKALNKQQYKSELALIRCQEELRNARDEQESFKIRAEHERQSKNKARQEAFERARTLASNIEELEVLKSERDVLQTENETLKAVENSMNLAVKANVHANLKEAGVQVKLDSIQEDESTSQRPQECVYCKGKSAEAREPVFEEQEVVQDLREELEWVKSQLKREMDIVHFMNMQCQFKACPCRQAEVEGARFVHDHVYDQKQQEMARAKGLKRKAEDDLPLLKYVRFRDFRARRRQELQAKQEALQLNEEVVTPVPHPQTERQPEQQPEEDTEQEPDQEVVTSDMKDNEPTLRAQPAKPMMDDEIMNDEIAAGVIPLEEAADIPLPSPRCDDLEPTALLEDMTQVMIEPKPVTKSNHFTFSTSTSSRKPLEAEIPILRQSCSAVNVNINDDLFDIAPPRHLPPRPSTVTGFSSIESPIRMVPPSPDHRISMTPATSPPRYRSVQVPLKDTSPLKNSVTHRRSRSQPRTRSTAGDRSRARSPTPGSNHGHNSPSTATVFPVTPKAKAERQARPLMQLQSNIHLPQTQTTTIRVPLRGMEEDDVFSHEKPTDYHQELQTQTIDSHARGRPLKLEHESSQHQTILPGTPITREAALAQIRARRDRARSVNMRKMAVENDEESGRVRTPKSAARRGVMLNREGRDISNLSQASAPARF